MYGCSYGDWMLISRIEEGIGYGSLKAIDGVFLLVLGVWRYIYIFVYGCE